MAYLFQIELKDQMDTTVSRAYFNTVGIGDTLACELLGHPEHDLLVSGDGSCEEMTNDNGLFALDVLPFLFKAYDLPLLPFGSMEDLLDKADAHPEYTFRIWFS